MIWFWLKVLDVLKPIFIWQGVDYGQLRAIVGTKLIMDNRRPFSLRVQQQQKESSSFFYTMIFGSLIGLVISFVISNIPSLIISFTIYHSFLIVMIMLLLISDFSSVLLDTSDNTIILPRPISSKTFFAARIAHILIYIGQLAFSLSIIPIGVTFFIYGKLIGVAMITTTVLSILLAVALTNGLYLLIMRFTSEERLKTIINYFQIFVTLFVMAGYQLLPRLLSISNFTKTTDNFQWWALLLPPMWMTGLIKLASNVSLEWIDISLVALAIFAPALIWKLITKYLTPHFTAKLSDLGTGSSGVALNEAETKAKKKPALNIKEWITQSGLERASYGLVWSALKHDRKLKLRVYPALGSIIIFILLPIIQSNKKGASFQEIFHLLNQTQVHLFAIYACIFILISVVYEIQFTDEFKSAWIYLSAPVKKPGIILSGALKAMIVKFFLPIYSITSALILSIWGSKATVDVVFGIVACLLLIITISVVSEKRLPLSMALTTRNQAASFTRAIVSILIIGALGFGHYVLSKFALILWIACPIMAVSCYFIWRLYSNATWEDVEI